MKIKYRSWLKSVTGTDLDDIILPKSVETVADLANFLSSYYENASAVFELPEALRYVIDRRYVDPSHRVTDSDSVEIYPPVTGG
ncbi:MoaD/ThiS family protein [Roseibium sp. AS2]|uniref:MoaD/ThiS family protein n=1 Tax=Roseibium sp. AS2 TaxID=3135781 RepID=UPI003178F4F1